MASQIAHIAFTDKVFSTYFGHLNRKDFYVGSVFPDIRYLRGITREETHVDAITLKDVQQERDSFEAGRKFHCLVDLAREEFLEKRGLYDMYEDIPDKYSVPKLLEDELFYDLVSHWPEIIDYFGEPLAGELAYPVPVGHIHRWHAAMKEYFTQPPSDESRADYACVLGFTPERVGEINTNLTVLRENSEICSVLAAFYEELESVLSAYH